MEDKITFSIHFREDEIKTFAEDNFGHKLTESELNKIAQCWSSAEDIDQQKCELLASIIEMVIEPQKSNKLKYATNILRTSLVHHESAQSNTPVQRRRRSTKLHS